MPTIPDDHSADYDNGPALAALRFEFPAWAIGFEAPLRIFSATQQTGDGRGLRYLAGHDVGELRARLETATAIDAEARR